MKALLIFALTIVIFSCSPKWSPDHYWAQKRWVLTEMKGVPVQLSGTSRDAYLEFSWTDKKFTGNGGCNRISGVYEFDKKSEIRFLDILSTKMSCADIAFENAFINTLQQVTRYEYKDNFILLKNGKETTIILESR